MAAPTIVLWICMSPSLKRFNQPLLAQLAAHFTVLEWEYQQDDDRGADLEEAVETLQGFMDKFLQTRRQPRYVHLAGHGSSGLVGLLYARRYPQWVRSLALLGVGSQPSLTWHSHYYLRRQLTHWSRPVILSQMVHSLFGQQSLSNHRCLRQRLQQDLDHSLTPHSLFRAATIAPGSPAAPLMVLGAADDALIDPQHLQSWQEYLKPSDRLWIAPQGRHFFHAHHPQPVAQQLAQFWASFPKASPLRQPVAPLPSQYQTEQYETGQY
ncbi:MAG: alpha/beta fold hydrolase [Prochlorothrix sp.]